MPDDPLVSVVIPCYQSVSTVAATISSVLTQTYPNLEIIVVDDGSTDGSADVLAAYGDLVVAVTQDNAGVSAARNSGICAARGDLIAILDADDVMLPSYVAAAVRAWLDAGAGRRFVTCEAYVLGAEGLFPKRRVLPLGAIPARAQRSAILERNIVSIMSVFPPEMSRELGGFDTGMTHSEDYDFWARAVFAGWEIVFQSDPQAVYRRAEGTASRSGDKILDGMTRVRRRIADQYADSLSDAERRILDLALEHGSSGAHIAQGEQALSAGDHATARAEFTLASRLSPSDRRLRLKARLLRIPGSSRVFSRLQERRLRQTGG